MRAADVLQGRLHSILLDRLDHRHQSVSALKEGHPWTDDRTAVHNDRFETFWVCRRPRVMLHRIQALDQLAQSALSSVNRPGIPGGHSV